MRECLHSGSPAELRSADCVLPAERRETLQGKYTGSKVHCRLSWSRDAATWQWVDKGGLTGADLIPLGAGPNDISKPGPNAFDSHMCAPLPPVHSTSRHSTRCVLSQVLSRHGLRVCF